MKKYIRSSRYNSDPSSNEKFAGFDSQKYYRLYVDLFHTITDGMNADLPNNVKEAFKLVGGSCRIEYVSPTYVKFDGSVAHTYTVGGSISTQYLDGDSRRLAEDLTMASFRTTEGKDVQCNTYEFVDWFLGEYK